MIPQLLVTLSPSGTLQCEIPGHNGSRQVIPLDDFQCATQLKHLLKDQLLKAAAESYIAHKQLISHKTYEQELERLIDKIHQYRLHQLREREDIPKPVSKSPLTLADLGL